MSQASAQRHSDARSSEGGLVQLLVRLWRHRDLLHELVKRELGDSYAGSMLSLVWAFLNPLLLIGLYVFIFGYVFTTRVGGNLPVEPDFAVYILSGLTIWLTVQAALAKSCSALVSSANLVKQVVFPIELLPVRSVLAAHIPLFVGILVVVLYSVVRFGMISPMLPLVVVVVAAQAALLMGLGLILAALTAFVRDTRDVVQFFLSFGIFLIPAVFLPGVLPGWFNYVLVVNPFSYAVWCMQDIFFFRDFEHPYAWLMLLALGPFTLHVGAKFFERVRSGFGDVL
jgi:lipopolysaccharide transport system permease protein